MASVFIDVTASCDLPIKPCDDIYLCLTDVWASQTVSGFAFAEATVTSISKVAVPPTSYAQCCSSSEECPLLCTYQVQVDDTQFLIDPITAEPYLLTVDDVQELFPYACTLGKILTLLTP